MNLSGVAVRKVLARERVPLEDLLVVVDDFALPLGRLRLREEGSAGGHNGLRSIIGEMGTQKFARLRVGIGEPGTIARDRPCPGRFARRGARDLDACSTRRPTRSRTGRASVRDLTGRPTAGTPGSRHADGASREPDRRPGDR